MPRASSVIPNPQFQNSFDSIPNKQKRPSSTRDIIKWNKNGQRHALLFYFGRCILRRSRVEWQNVCVCAGEGLGRGKEDSMINVIYIKLCCLPPERIPCHFPRDMA